MTIRNHHYVYQHIVDLQSLELVRYEALLRVDGVKNIEDYIKGLEQSLAIINLDLNTIASVISQIEDESILSKYPVAVNISAVSINYLNFQKVALEIIKQRRVRTGISLEITETAPIKCIKQANLFVKELHRAAVR